MNREQKAAVVDEVAAQIQDADAVFAVDYRGLSVTQAVELRARLVEVEAGFRVVKNRLTSRAVDKVGAEPLKELLEGPTAFTFVKGDAALAAKALATFRRAHGLLEFKGGTMDGEPLSAEQLEAISRLPARETLQGQFVGVLASPLTGLARGLGSLIQGLALQLGQIGEQGLVGDGAGAARAAASSGEPEAQDGEAEAEPDAGAEEPREPEADTAAGGGDAPDAEQAEDESRAQAAEEEAPDEGGGDETRAQAAEEEAPDEGGGDETPGEAVDASGEQSGASDEAEAKEE